MNLFITKVTPRGTKNEIFNITSAVLPRRMIDDAYTWIDEKMISIDEDSLIEKTKSIRMYALLLSKSGRGRNDQRLIENLGEALRIQRSLIYSRKNIDYLSRLDNIRDLTYFILEYGNEEEKRTVDSLIAASMSKISLLIERDGLTDAIMNLTVKSIDLVRGIGKEPDLRALQDAVYPSYLRKGEKSDALRRVFSTLNFH